MRDWQRLRAWEKRPHTIRRRDCYKATSLLSGINEGRLRVTILPALLKYLAKHPPTNYKGEPGRPKHRHGFLASLVMLACLTRRAPAVLGKLDDFGDLMGVSRRTAWSDLEYLCSINLLTKMPDYKVGRSYGRAGEAIEHRQLPNWYAPGPELRTIWRAFEAEQAQKAAKWEERFPSSAPSDLRSAKFTIRRCAQKKQNSEVRLQHDLRSGQAWSLRPASPGLLAKEGYRRQRHQRTSRPVRYPLMMSECLPPQSQQAWNLKCYAVCIGCFPMLR